MTRFSNICLNHIFVFPFNIITKAHKRCTRFPYTFILKQFTLISEGPFPSVTGAAIASSYSCIKCPPADILKLFSQLDFSFQCFVSSSLGNICLFVFRNCRSYCTFVNCYPHPAISIYRNPAKVSGCHLSYLTAHSGDKPQANRSQPGGFLVTLVVSPLCKLKQRVTAMSDLPQE